ncbi:MAG: 30S ribosomal protein S4 [Minisyncoccia bacterium]
MINRPKYKVARKLGPAVFDKTQTQKYAVRAARRNPVMRKNSRPKTAYGLQLLEKQKAKVTYGLTERVFARYVNTISATNARTNNTEKLIETLERRLDNVVYRLGLANSRQFSRQMVSHGHICVNGQKVTIPSFAVSVGDKISIREGSQKSKMFENLDEKMKSYKFPSWLNYDPAKKVFIVQGMPKLAIAEVMFDIPVIFEFYNR